MKRSFWRLLAGCFLLMTLATNAEINPFERVVAASYGGFYQDHQGFVLELDAGDVETQYNGKLYYAGETAEVSGTVEGSQLSGHFVMSGLRVPFTMSPSGGQFHFVSDGFEATLEKSDKPEFAGLWSGQSFSIMVEPQDDGFKGTIRMNGQIYAHEAGKDDAMTLAGSFSDDGGNRFPFELSIDANRSQATFSTGNFRESLSWESLDAARKMLAQEDFERLSKAYFDARRAVIDTFINALGEYKRTCTNCSPMNWNSILFAKDDGSNVQFVGGMQGFRMGRRLNPDLNARSIHIANSSVRYDLGIRVEATASWDDLLSPDTRIFISKQKAGYQGHGMIWQMQISNDKKDIWQKSVQMTDAVREAIDHQAYPGCDDYSGCVDVAAKCQRRRCYLGDSDYYWSHHLSGFYDKNHLYWPIKTVSADNVKMSGDVKRLTIRVHQVDAATDARLGALFERVEALEAVDVVALGRADSAATGEYRSWLRSVRIRDCSTMTGLGLCI